MRSNLPKVLYALGALGVIIGAFGAHALKTTLVENSSLETYKTGVLYHFIHVLMALAIQSSEKFSEVAKKQISYLSIAGIILFSLSLYGLSIFEWTWLGPITPIGGLFLISSWIYAAVKYRH